VGRCRHWRITLCAPTSFLSALALTSHRAQPETPLFKRPPHTAYFDWLTEEGFDDNVRLDPDATLQFESGRVA
jgi:hypothetical protein